MGYLKEHYARLETDELLKLRSSDLIDEARAVLEAELKSRDGTEDAIDSATRRRVVSHVIDVRTAAPLRKRFVAGAIDYGGTLAVLTAVNFLVYISAPKGIADLIGYASLLAWFVYVLFRDASLKYGFGKRLVGIRVVQVGDGELCSPGQSLLRNLFHPLWPIDWAFALGVHSRRLGDLVAGTYVVEA